MQLVESIEHSGKTVKVYFDPEPLNPRTEWDNATVMVHWHPRQELGDAQIEKCDAESFYEMGRRNNDPILAILPLYLYDHSGLSISTGPFRCAFDSGQVGWVYITESKRKLMGFAETTTKEEYEQIIRQEVQTYDDYLTGQVFGYEVEGKDGEVIESLWGIMGDSDEALKEGKAAAKRCVDPAIEREAAEEKRKQDIACIIQNAWTEPMGMLIERASNVGLKIESASDSRWVATISVKDGEEQDFFLQTNKGLRAFILGYACALNQAKE